MIRCSLHNHTTYCDGRDTPREMALAAIEQGLETVGFSAHSPFPPVPGSGMDPEVLPGYRTDILALQEELQDRIWVALGWNRTSIPLPPERAGTM